MPKVGKEFVNDQSLGMYMEFDVHFNKKNQFHVKFEEGFLGMPEAHSGVMYASTYDVIVEAVRKAVKAFWQASAKEPERVILYKIYRTLSRGAIPYHPGFDEISFAKGSGLTVDFHMRYMLEYNNEVLVSRYDNPKGQAAAYSLSGMQKLKHSDYSSYKIIPWTEEREAFFNSLDEKIKNLIMGITDFFGEDTQALLSNIENNSIKLLGQ